MGRTFWTLENKMSKDQAHLAHYYQIIKWEVVSDKAGEVGHV